MVTTIFPTDEEALEGIACWTITTPEPANEAAFEQDRIARLNARYAATLRTHGKAPVSLVNGSIGATSIPKAA